MDRMSEFIKYVKKECEAYDVKLILSNTKSVHLNGSSRCGGYFVGYQNRGELSVAKKHPLFHDLLVHEFCHLKQWSEGYNCDEPYNVLYDWLEYRRDVTNIEKWLDKCLAYELDCEKRAVKLIKKWGLPIDVPLYIKRANAYMYFWKYIKYTRMFGKPGVSIYQPQILDAMPTRFKKEYKLTNKLFNLYVTAGI